VESSGTPRAAVGTDTDDPMATQNTVPAMGDNPRGTVATRCSAGQGDRLVCQAALDAEEPTTYSWQAWGHYRSGRQRPDAIA
jgi:hypothetical protein